MVDYKELIYQRDIVHQQRRDIRKWQQYESFEKLRERKANKFAKKLVDKINLPSPQEQDTLVKRLASELDLKFVEKNTLIYSEKSAEEKLCFVVIGSVGLYKSSTEFYFPFALKRNGSVSVNTCACLNLIVIVDGILSKARVVDASHLKLKVLMRLERIRTRIFLRYNMARWNLSVVTIPPFQPCCHKKDMGRRRSRE